MELIKADIEIASQLFMFDYIPEDVTLWTGSDEAFDFSNMHWLFKTDIDNFSLVGINTLDYSVWCIDDECDFHKDCVSLQDFPYEIIKLGSFYTEHETLSSYFKKYSGWNIKSTLARYEDWCHKNNILLDKNNVYHDENGKLFENFSY